MINDPSLFDTIWKFFSDGGVFMILLLALSVSMVVVLLGRLVALRTHLVIPARLEKVLEESAESPDDVLPLCDDSALGKISKAACHARNRKEAESIATSTAREEIHHLQSGLGWLEIVITIAPLLGLLGTASGLLTVFNHLGAGDGDQMLTARGIAEALVTTIAGLAVAVPAVIGHTYLSRKIERLATRMESCLARFIGRIS